jgi:hypothetical protein
LLTVRIGKYDPVPQTLPIIFLLRHILFDS